MSRKTIFLGAPLEVTSPPPSGSPYSALGQRRSWPDIDSAGAFAAFPAAQFAEVKALALAAATDWDLIVVKTAGGNQEIVGPGRLLVLDAGDAIVDIQPITNWPSTRSYNAALQRSGLLPQPRADWFVKASDASYNIMSASGPGVPLYNWNGTAWVSVGPTGSNPPFVPPSVTLDLNNTILLARATDYSPDGVWSFADYVENGAIVSDNGASIKGLSYVASTAVGNLGTPGDLSAFSTTHFGFRWGQLSPLFFGALAVDVFNDSCVDWAPRLPSQRQLSFPPIAVGPIGAPGVNQVILSVPCFNVDSVEWVLHNAGGTGAGSHSIYATIAEQTLDIPLTTVGGIPLTDGTTFYNTIVANDYGAILAAGIRQPMVKLLAGADGGANIVAGSTLTLTRRFTH
jgi:hypothetical protein